MNTRLQVEHPVPAPTPLAAPSSCHPHTVCARLGHGNGDEARPRPVAAARTFAFVLRTSFHRSVSSSTCILLCVIQVAAGHKIPAEQSELKATGRPSLCPPSALLQRDPGSPLHAPAHHPGHALEARVYAENPQKYGAHAVGILTFSALPWSFLVDLHPRPPPRTRPRIPVLAQQLPPGHGYADLPAAAEDCARLPVSRRPRTHRLALPSLTR